MSSYSSGAIDKYAADISRDIVVSALSNSDSKMNQETGRTIADFYSEIFSGISGTLKRSDIADK